MFYGKPKVTRKRRNVLVLLLTFTLVLPLLSVENYAQAQSKSQATTKDHDKQVIGYFTQWDAWKGTAAGLPAQGALTHLNIDYSKYTILNYSFFGVAHDGSLHSGDYRDKNIYKPGVVQQPAPLFYTDIYSSWDLYILFGELDPVYAINEDVVRRARAEGFEVTEWGNTWSHPDWGLYDQPLPLPLKKEGGAPGVLELAKENDVKVLASIGGWSMCRHFPEVAADPAKRKKFVDDCVKLINIGFDGIDLDWEYPGPFEGMNFVGTEDDYDNFITLAREIREAIGDDKLLTSCFSADVRKLEGYDWDEVDKVLDYYNFMSYDFNGGWSDKAGHNSPLYSYDDAEAPNFNWDYLYDSLASMGVNLSKVNMGMAFYGRGVITDGPATLNAPTIKRQEFVQPDGNIWTCADYTNWPKDVFDGTPYYYYIKQTALAPNSGWTRHWDSQAKVPYLTKDNFFLSYDDEESVGYKAQYIKDKNLAGTIIWTAYEDLELGGSVTNYGNKLKKWSDVKSPLVDKINEVFAEGFVPKEPEDPKEPEEPEDPKEPEEPEDPKEPEEPEDPTDPGQPGYPVWDSSKVYVGGDRVYWNGSIWEAKWWTQGEEPGTTDEWGVWNNIDGPEVPEEPEDPGIGDGTWDRSKTYIGGDRVSWNGSIWEAKWWTQGEEPGTTGEWGVWKLISAILDPEDPEDPKDPTDPEDPPIVDDGFKVVGYYPSWQPNKLDRIQYDILTHINYAFAIPTPEGTLRPLENPETARTIIEEAHANGVKVLIAVGGWSYNDVPLEGTFVQATNTDEKIEHFANEIMKMVNEYGFDGVDMDWEHPRRGEPSQHQYEKLMLVLNEKLRKEGKLLTSAVLSGVTPDGIEYWDSAAHTDKVLNCVDWINVMAYDGGDGERHSGYNFAVNCGLYWRDTRNMPAEKVVLGVPFYGRPSWATYDEILQANPDAYKTDVSMINGIQAHYNGIPTIKKKTTWATQELGGIMMWEVSQDTLDREKSLLSAIGEIVRLGN